MKRYTVKEVVKLEQKAEYLKKLDRQRLGDELFFPLMLLFNMGLAMSSLYFTGENQTIAPLIIGGTAQLIGGGSYAYYNLLPARLKNLRNKIYEIYKTMGNDFKEDVEREFWKQYFDGNSHTK